MTDLERIEAVEEWIVDTGIECPDYVFKTILEALRFQKAALGEPSDEILLAGVRGWRKDPACKSSTLFKAMIAELSKQVKENKE